MFKEVIIVEGRDDTRRLKEIFGEVDTFETGGSAVDSEKLKQIRTLQENRGIIVFTDPDYPGQKIRQMIIEEIPRAKHAYLDQDDALSISGAGLGVEYASEVAIRAALNGVMTPMETIDEQISQAFLLKWQLIASVGSKKKRQVLASKLGIGYVNGKQLKKRLNMFGITKEQIISALEE